MTFTVTDLIYAAVFGLVVGVFVLNGFNSQHKSENSGALAALQQRMGSLYNVAWFAASGLPMVTVWLLGSALRGQPSLTDTIILIVPAALGMLASFTLIGTLMKLLGEQRPPTGQS